MNASPVPEGEPVLRVTVALGEPSVVTVSGDADLDGQSALREAVDRALAHHPHLVFDLAGVSFADSTFLTVLATARLAALEQAGSVSLLAVSAPVQRLLDLTGAAVLFPAVAPGRPEPS
ncbi:STAS domain-containing protein [Streptomyces sp. NBC_01477]|uniref:STAS domain-containing protein n=1 Tax=Streptomyces sp. NBC_01477 TaxID=2976015 RepID=UPI002E33459A|nr:STAS domain-containing protein [Streptomyces sp. NBC_01477]